MVLLLTKNLAFIVFMLYKEAKENELNRSNLINMTIAGCIREESLRDTLPLVR